MSGIDLKPLPPREAIEAFARKGLKASFDWRDMEREEHTRALTVAGLMKLDLLDEVRKAMTAALEEGTTLRDFQKRLTPILQEGGWWGRQDLVDPETGEVRQRRLGSPRRLEIIYDTNLRMAHAAGRWERIEETAAARPWLRYVAVLDERTRPLHRAWHDTVLPWDDPWWGMHAPPNGWRCRCSIQQLSDRDLTRRSLTPSKAPAVQTRDWVNGRTGEVRKIPVGVDPGFDYNVGRANLDHLRRTTAQRMDAAPPDLARAAAQGFARSGGLASFLRSPGSGEAGLPLAMGGERLGASVSAVTLPPRAARAIGESGASLTPEDWLQVQAMIDAAAASGAKLEGGALRLRAGGLVLDLELDPSGRLTLRDLRKTAP